MGRLLQVVDGPQARGVALDQDELKPFTEDRLDGALVPCVGAQHVGDQSVYAVAPALVLVAQQDGFDAPAISFEVLLQLEE